MGCLSRGRRVAPEEGKPLGAPSTSQESVASLTAIKQAAQEAKAASKAASKAAPKAAAAK